METEDQGSDYAVEKVYPQELELLKGMFEDHFSSEVIAGVLQDCCGDVNLAVDNLTKIDGIAVTAVNHPIDTPTEIECNSTAESHVNNMATNNAASLQAHSYATASRAPVTATGATPVIRNPPQTRNHMPKIDYWTDQMRKIINDYNEGSRVLIVMRGAPGSGKSYLARVIVESTVGTSNPNNHANHIFSSDDHMQVNGRYHYNVNRLDETHMKNQMRAHKALTEGRSPVIVDNTNMKLWEMYAYVRDAVANGYIIEVVEPSNPWSKNPSQLAKRNSHGVPKEKIQLMLQKYEGTHTGESLVKYFQLCYPKGMKPPVKRNVPPFTKPAPLLVTVLEKLEPVIAKRENHVPPSHDHNIDLVSNDLQNENPYINETPRNINETPRNINESPRNINETPRNINETPRNINDTLMTSKIDESSYRDNHVHQQQMEAQKSLVEMLKLEVEWDSGDGWETPLSNGEPNIEAGSSLNPKPPRSTANKLSDNCIQPSRLYATKETSQIKTQPEPISTVVERDDLINNEHKTFSEPQNGIEIPNNNKTEPNHNGRCVHQEKHFVQLRKMFKNVPRAVLREIFDNCAGDVDWACSIVLDGIQQNNLQAENAEESASDEEEELDSQCQCDQLRNDIILDTSAETMPSITGKKATTVSLATIKKKTKKDKNVTSDSFIIKRQIENSVMISDHNYSQHYLNLRRQRLDNKSPNGSSNENPKEVIIPQNDESYKPENSIEPSSQPSTESGLVANVPDTSQNNHDKPSTSYAKAYDAVPSTSGTGNYMPIEADDEGESEDEDDSMGSDDDKPEMRGNVTVNVGMEFVRKLDELFGRHDFAYPEGVNPVLSIPTKIMFKLNALWVESITYQLDKVQTQTDEMIQQDEEFARKLELQLQLEAEEAENLSEVTEDSPEDSNQPPESREQSFKEIMDTELALAIYEREVREEWKNKEPQDMAAQMTRKKLYELFPDVANETLSEMLIAHGNSFDNTVEVLLISTGQGQYLDQTNGINKFVMEKEKENKDKLMLAEQNAALDEEEYPYLFKPGKEHTDLNMATVNQMRDKAEMHKNARDLYFNKAKWYYDRKKLAEASHYSRIAALHTARYETASNYAAAVLVQYHAELHPGTNVIDLHFLRVPEAETSLDLFIDDRLRKMRLAPEPRTLILHIITGRGKHSPGRPRVKPAIMKRLKARGLPYRQQNPGLLEARLKPTHLLLEELLNS